MLDLPATIRALQIPRPRWLNAEFPLARKNGRFCARKVGNSIFNLTTARAAFQADSIDYNVLHFLLSWQGIMATTVVECSPRVATTAALKVPRPPWLNAEFHLGSKEPWCCTYITLGALELDIVNSVFKSE